MSRASPGDLLAFYNGTVLSFEDDACLEWPFWIDTKGYGGITIKGKTCRVHRLVCRHFNGRPPSSTHDAAHSCNNRKCCNKRHLRWATRSENLADRIAHGTANRGERHGMSRLTADNVRQIRVLRLTVEQQILARRFKVSEATISRCVSGVTWGWLK